MKLLCPNDLRFFESFAAYTAMKIGGVSQRVSVARFELVRVRVKRNREIS